MQLITALATGIQGAESGSAEFYRYGSTSTFVTVYGDELGDSVLSTPYTLDANGALVAYVDERCEVVVRASSGAELRRFVPIVDATSVDVSSASFTGAASDGTQAIGGLVDLATIADRWVESGGAPDWKVRRTGQPSDEYISDAFDAISAGQSLFNIRFYGALCDGTSDDSTAWNNAIAAAAVRGGIVFHPGGDSYVGSGITVTSPKVSILGTSGGYARIKIPGGIGYALTYNCGTSSQVYASVRSIGFTAGSAVTSGAMSITTTPGMVIEDCVFDVMAGNSNTIVNVASRTTFRGCFFNFPTTACKIAMSSASASGSQFHGCKLGATTQLFGSAANTDMAGVTNVMFTGIDATLGGSLTSAGSLINLKAWVVAGWASNPSSGSTIAVLNDAVSEIVVTGYSGHTFNTQAMYASNASPYVVYNRLGAKDLGTISASGSQYLYPGTFDFFYATINTSLIIVTLDTPGSSPPIGGITSFLFYNSSGGNVTIAFVGASWQAAASITIPSTQRTRFQMIYVGAGLHRMLGTPYTF
jgi:hypothetical protein